MSDDTQTGSGTFEPQTGPAPEGQQAPAPDAVAPEQPTGAESDSEETTGDGAPGGARKRRRRGSRGGRSRSRPATETGADEDDGSDGDDGGESSAATPAATAAELTNGTVPVPGRVDTTAPLVPLIPPPRPRIGDSRPAPPAAAKTPAGPAAKSGRGGDSGRGNGGDGTRANAGDGTRGNGGDSAQGSRANGGTAGEGSGAKRRRRNRGKGGGSGSAAPGRPVEAVLVDEPVELDEETLERRRGRERKGRPVGRYTMVVHSRPAGEAGTGPATPVTQIAVLEGRALIEHYVSRPADDANQIDGNIYLGRVQNVLPGMEAAFIDIGTPKNAVLYRGDVRYDKDDIEAGDSDAKPTRGKLPGAARDARIEQLLKTGQTILCQVTKNPIGTKGARLTQEVSLPGRFVVLIPHSDTYGISKRLADDERKRLRRILDEVRPAGHGLIVRTAAEGATADELRRDVARLSQQWERIDQMAKSTRAPALLYREPDMAVRVIREEFNRNYRTVVIDDRALFEEVRDYVSSINPELADRIEWAGDSDDPLPVFERYHVHEQIHKALDRKVWLPSGGSLIIERTEALTVIDVNTGKNVGTSNLEETVFRNNLEAAEEVARQLRLRDIGGIIVIDFIDMEIAANRQEVIKTFRGALSRDKTRTQVFDISELGLVEMTRKRISEGLIESLSESCPTCGGRGIVFDESLL
ncbi:MAG TPA: Rne/Rng family ribonuclease [Acidimicrobiales bacterium]|jgi:ribonuclease E|nr:Rne/Rng family ribonuclease [Acidimicrobiales bacterium]